MGFMMGVSYCPLEHWGAHPGEVCSGPELSLQPLAPGQDLAGWWRVEDPKKESHTRRGLDLRYFLIDAEQRPRAWIHDEPWEYEKEFRMVKEPTFGCEDYMDFPLVVGQTNISPDTERNTIYTGGCAGDAPIQASSRRTLLERRSDGARSCLVYAVWSVTYDSSSENKGGSRLETLCFAYRADLERLEVSYAFDDAPLVSYLYKRVDVAQEEQDALASEDSDSDEVTPDEEDESAIESSGGDTGSQTDSMGVQS